MGNGLNDELRLSQCVPRPSAMRPKFFGTAGSCRCEAKSPKRPSKTFGGPVTPAPASSAAVIPLCAANPECRNFVCVPSTQHSRSPAAQLPAVPAAQASCSTPSPRIFPAPHGDAERREEPGRMKAAPMELPGRHAADAARDLVGDRDRQNQLASGHRPRLGERERGRHRGTAHVHDRLVVRVVVLERLRQRGVGERGRRRADRVAGAEDPAGPGGDIAVAAAIVERPNGVSAPASARPITSRMRSLVASTTSEGRSSYRTSDTHSAT